MTDLQQQQKGKSRYERKNKMVKQMDRQKERPQRYDARRPNGYGTTTRGEQNNGQTQTSTHPEPATGCIIGVVGKPYGRQLERILDDERLGSTAVGILVYLLYRPPGWDVSVVQLQRRFHGHRLLIRQAFKEMEAAGYAARAQLRSLDGRHACGERWFIRLSFTELWPEIFVTRELNSLRVHFRKSLEGRILPARKRPAKSNTDKKPRTIQNDNARER